MFSLTRKARRETRTQAGGGPWHTHTQTWTLDMRANVLFWARVWAVCLLLKCLEWKDSHPVLRIEVTWYDFRGFVKEPCTGLFFPLRVIESNSNYCNAQQFESRMYSVIILFFMFFDFRTYPGQIWQRSLKWQPAAGRMAVPLMWLHEGAHVVMHSSEHEPKQRIGFIQQELQVYLGYCVPSRLI